MEKKIEDLKNKLLYAVGKCSDYRRYAMLLGDIEEEYDETLEVYHLDVWMRNSQGTIVEKAEEMISVTTELFEDMRQNAEKELYYVIQEIMGLQEDVQKEIWGINFTAENFTKEDFEDIIDGWDDVPSIQQEALEAFLNHFKEKIEDML